MGSSRIDQRRANNEIIDGQPIRNFKEHEQLDSCFYINDNNSDNYLNYFNNNDNKCRFKRLQNPYSLCSCSRLNPPPFIKTFFFTIKKSFLKKKKKKKKKKK